MTSILVEEDAERSLADVLARRADFVRPAHPHGNLGPRQHAVWLRVPLMVPVDAPRDWIVVIDYPSLDRIDLYLTDDAGVLQHARMGRDVPYADRPWPSSVHATPIVLDEGRRYRLFVRIATTSTMVVPLSLATRCAPRPMPARSAKRTSPAFATRPSPPRGTVASASQSVMRSHRSMVTTRPRSSSVPMPRCTKASTRAAPA